MTSLKDQLLQLTRDLGFADCRIAPALPAAHRELFEAWVAEGRHGDMAWMARNLDRRTDPRLVQPGAKSVVVLAMNYYQGELPAGSAGGYRIARYAWNQDYHDLIEKKLQALDGFLADHGGRQRCYVDTGPVLERDFAGEAGLGWNGKSTMQIHRRLGTWFFLAELITTLDLPADRPQEDRCGRCTRCLDACPTQAITAPRRLDARRCISYLTIEHKGAIPEDFRRAIGDRIYGCDDCLAVCPWNKFAQAGREQKLAARADRVEPPLAELAALDDAAFRKRFARSPVKRTGRDRFLRNVLYAIGNSGDRALVPAAEARLGDASPLVRGAAVWALSRLLAEADFEALAQTRAGREDDSAVRDEWARAQSA